MLLRPWPCPSLTTENSIVMRRGEVGKYGRLVSSSVDVQVFGRRNNGLSTHSDGRRPKSAKAGNRGLGTAVVPQLWGFRRGRRRRCGGTRRQGTQFCHAAWA